MESNGIRHVCRQHHHPASINQGKALMKVVKGALKRRLEESLQTRVSRFLFAYRNAPQSTTGRAPAELIFGRALRTPLERLRSSLRAAVGAQAASKAKHDRRAQVRTFSAGDCSGQAAVAFRCSGVHLRTVE